MIVWAYDKAWSTVARALVSTIVLGMVQVLHVVEAVRSIHPIFKISRTIRCCAGITSAIGLTMIARTRKVNIAGSWLSFTLFTWLCFEFLEFFGVSH